MHFLIFWTLLSTSHAQSDFEKLSQLNERAAKNSSVVIAGPHLYKISRNLAFRPDVTLELQKGAVLAPMEGVTVEIRGPFQAGLSQIFSGDGKIKLAQVAQVYPQWWGAYSDDSHPEETTRALQAALDSGAKVFIPNGTYSTHELNLSQEGAIVEGSNREKTILKAAGAGDSVLNMTALFQKVSDLKVEGRAKDHGATTIGLHLNGSSRSQIQNVRVSGFGYGIQLSKLAGNNINHCYLYKNTRAGIYMYEGGHGLSIDGGTEIAGSPFGIVMGRFREKPFGIDYDFARVNSQMVSIKSAIIEGIHAVGGAGGVGIYNSMGQKGLSVTDTYFEEMDVALQLGSAARNDGVKHSTGVLNTTFRDNFLSGVHSAIKVGRVNMGDISNNHCAGVENMFDTSDAGLFINVKVGQNYGYTKLISKPFNGDFGKSDQ